MEEIGVSDLSVLTQIRDFDNELCFVVESEVAAGVCRANANNTTIGCVGRIWC